MLARNGNEITPDYVDRIHYMVHAWENQEERLLNVRGKRFWVPEWIGDLYYRFKNIDPAFAREFVIRYKEAWWYLKGFNRKPADRRAADLEQCKRIGQTFTLWIDKEDPTKSYITDRDPGLKTNDLDFGTVKGNHLAAEFRLGLEKLGENFGIIYFEVFSISKKLKIRA